MRKTIEDQGILQIYVDYISETKKGMATDFMCQLLSQPYFLA